MLHMELKICLLSEVPGTCCAAKQLLFIAMFNCQMHLQVRREWKKQFEMVHL